MRFSIKYKLFLGFAFVLALAFLIQGVIFTRTQVFIQDQVHTFQQEKAQNAASIVQDFVTRLETDHLGIAESFIVDDANYSETIVLINFVLFQKRFYNRISILSNKGREMLEVSRDGVLSSSDLSFEIPTGPFDKALAGEIGISKVYFLGSSSIPHVDVFSPIQAVNGDVVAVVKNQIQLDRLWDLFSQTKVGESGFVYVVDEEGRLIAHPNLELVLRGPNFSERPIVQSLLLNETGSNTKLEYEYINEENIRVIANGTRIPTFNWIVLVEEPAQEALAYIDSTRQLTFTMVIASILGLTIIALFLSNNLTRSIRTLQRVADQLQKGELQARADVQSHDEIQDLGISLNKMTESLLKIGQDLEQDKEAISVEKNKLSVILSGISDAVIAVDLDYKIIMFNKIAEQLLGYSGDEVFGKRINEVIQITEEDIVLSPEAYAPIRTDGFEGIVLAKKEVQIKGAIGIEATVRLTASQIKEAPHTNLGCILTLHDMTGEKKLEEMKLDFVSMAAHELRTPLTAINGYLSVFLEEKGLDLNEDQQMLLGRVRLASQQLGTLVENLLNVSQIERGSLKLNIKPANWEIVVANAVEDQRNRAKDKFIDLQYVAPEKKVPFVLIDQLRITEVLNNLIANAINYTNEGGKVRVWIEPQPHEVVTYIQDTGIGIPPEALPRLFTKFFRVSGILEQGSKGTGLGLYISKSIIEMHNGRIWVDSELERGSTFMFSLPIDE